MPRVNCIDVDNQQGAYNAVSHLISQGYRRIGTITGSQMTIAGIARYQGYLNALRDHGLSPDKSLVMIGNFSEFSGFNGMQNLLPHQPDAVFAASDTMALGALHAIKRAGLCVPDDIALVGFDDIKTASITNPALTTIRQPIKKTGETAVSLLLELLSNDHPQPQQKILGTELIIRESCGSHLK